MKKPCLSCGELVDRTYCDICKPPSRPKPSTANGYDTAWRKLSERARRLQPFCSACGTTADLTADHSPEAWQRKEKGLPIRLADIDVLCRSHNAKKGAARGASLDTRGVDPHPGHSDPTGGSEFASVLKVQP